jgi:hypothetical protein
MNETFQHNSATGAPSVVRECDVNIQTAETIILYPIIYKNENGNTEYP